MEFDKESLRRQVTVIGLMLDGVTDHRMLRPDLEIVAAKLRLVDRHMDAFAENDTELASMKRLLRVYRARWADLYLRKSGRSHPFFGSFDCDDEDDDARPPAPPASASGPAPARTWTPEEERRFASTLDDLSILIFSAFGRVLEAARKNGVWLMRVGPQAYLASELRAALIESAPDPTAAARDVALDAVLLAVRAGLTTSDFRLLAESITPAVPEVTTREDPDQAILLLVNQLEVDELVEWKGLSIEITPKGLERAAKVDDRWRGFRFPAGKPEGEPRPSDQGHDPTGS